MGLVAMLSAFLRRLFQLLLIISGNVPEHVAFVMDGNRRYAEQQHVDKATGHTHGYGKASGAVVTSHSQNRFAWQSSALRLSATTRASGMWQMVQPGAGSATQYSPDDLLL